MYSLAVSPGASECARQPQKLRGAGAGEVSSPYKGPDLEKYTEAAQKRHACQIEHAPLIQRDVEQPSVLIEFAAMASTTKDKHSLPVYRRSRVAVPARRGRSIGLRIVPRQILGRRQQVRKCYG